MRALASAIVFEKSLPMASTGDIAVRRMVMVISLNAELIEPITTDNVMGSRPSDLFRIAMCASKATSGKP